MGFRSALLLVLKDGEEDRRIDLEAGSLELGRAEDNEICLPHISVSRRHARIFVTEDRVVFEDLGSGNGSWFKGRRIRTQTLVDGDEILIDPFTLRLELEELPSVQDLVVDQTDATYTDVGGSDHTELLTGPDADLISMVESEVPRARLETLSGSQLEEFYEVAAEGLTLGRSDQRDVVLVDVAASRLHCEIVYNAGCYQVRDPGSANGIFINGRRVREKDLDDGDTLRIGSTEFRWVQEGSVAPSTVAIEEAPPEHTENFSAVIPGSNPSPPPLSFGGEPPVLDNPVPVGLPPSSPPDFSAPEVGLSPPPELEQAPPLYDLGRVGEGPPVGNEPPPGFSPQANDAGQLGVPAFGTPSAGTGGGGPARHDPLAPDLGAAPVGGGFGGVEMSFGAGGSSRRSQGGFLGSSINRISLGILAMVIVVMGFKFLDGRAGCGGPIIETPPTVAPEKELLYARKMEEGLSAFRDGRYQSASTKFAEAMELIPDRPGAQRMATYSFEFVVIDTLENVVAGNAQSAEEKTKLKEDALALAQKALAGNSVKRSRSARKKVQEAIEILGEDRELAQAEKDLSKKIKSQGGAIRIQDERKKAAEVEDLYKTCSGEMQRRNYPQAEKCFREVMALDPDRKTEYFALSEDGKKKADNEMRKKAQPSYQQGVSYMNQGRNSQARSKFKEALRFYPEYTSAKKKLESVQSLLKQQASERFKQAKVYEEANQIDKAIVYYKEVKSLVGNPKDRLHKMAQDRINSLVQ